MPKLVDLPRIEREHWKLHLKAVVKDTPSVGNLVNQMIRGGELPSIKHPAYIHDWLEQLDRRKEIEALDG